MNTVSTTTGDITDATFILDAAYTAAQQVEGGWSLPPAVVAVLAPSAPTAPLSLLDLALPEGFGGMPGTPAVMGPQSYSAPTTIASNGLLTVSMDRDATTQNPGVVTVSVPEQIVASRQGFSFSLPAAMAEAAASGGVRVTRVNGEALPAWLHYAKANKSFFASPLPAGALPAEVLVRIGARRWTVLITQ
jgi:hypothetical protein